MTILVPLLMFALGAGLVAGVYAAATHLPATIARRRIDSRIRDVSAPPVEDAPRTVVKRHAAGPLPIIDRLAHQSRAGSALATLIEQSGAKATVSGVVLTGFALGIGCALIATALLRVAWVAPPAALVGLAIPIGLLRRRRTARLKKFEEHFPEALDLLSRAIRAGHAFTTAMGMVAEEAGDPIGPEFRKTFDEQNFGLPLKDALNAMSERVPILDVRFFVTAVLIQRETGGNLSEILDNLAGVVRERFKVLRQVRVHTAHGRMTGYVLLGLPAVLAVALSIINPDHMSPLFRERMGHMMLVGAIVMQVIGYFWIKRVVTIEV